MNKLMIFTILAFIGPTFAAEPAKAVAPQTANSNELKIGVKGMVCAFCAQGIEKKFKAQKEVSKIHVSLENKLVTVTFKEGQRLSNEKILEILKDAGYEAELGK